MINKKLKIAIVTKFDSQADFAQALGITQSKISEVVRHRRTLPEEQQGKWVRVSEREPQELFTT